MNRAKVTIESEADFVITMIERDMKTLKTNTDRLDYLTIIMRKVDSMGDEIVDKKFIGEDRPENEENDVDLSSATLITILNNLIRDDFDEKHGFKSKTPIEFIDDSLCLIDEAVQEWFKRKDLGPYSFNHIHVYEDQWFMVVQNKEFKSTDDFMSCKCTWKDNDGNIHENTMLEITKLIFNKVYLPSLGVKNV